VLGRLDAVCLLISAIVVLDTLGAVAKGGAQTMTWLAVVAALFFVPAGLVIAELGAAFRPRVRLGHGRPGRPAAAGR
jgi:glutamate:GABA antiporter